MAVLFKSYLNETSLPDIVGNECVSIKMYPEEVNPAVGAFDRPLNAENTFLDEVNDFLCSCSTNTCTVSWRS